MIGGVAVLDVFDFHLLVNVYQDISIDDVQESGPLDFVRLKNHIAVREDDCGSPGL